MSRRGIDTNVLVYGHVPGFEQHEKVRAFLLRELVTEGRILVVTPMVLHEFVHVVTDGRRFDPPVTMSEAVAIARDYLGRTNVECASVDESALRRAFDLIDRHQLGRKRIADTLLASSLLALGVREILTCNPDDFSSFEGLTPIDPLA